MTEPAVTIIQWPADAARLDELRIARAPRLIAVPRGETPPMLRIDDELEDWVRWPAPADEMAARSGRLAAHAAALGEVHRVRGV